MQFVYINNAEDADKATALGYHLIKKDYGQQLWTFSKKDNINFDSEDDLKKSGINYVLSDTLTF